MKQSFNVLHRYGFLMLMILLFLPLLFLNVTDSHDWGGDFAMYIMEARNILNGDPVSETNYIYNPDNPVLGPPSYPVGFPLLLVPVMAIFGQDIHVLITFMSFFLIVFLIVSLWFFRNYFSNLIIFFLIILMAYNPWMIMFKMEVMSDIPFGALLIFLVILTGRSELISWKMIVAMGMLSGFLISIRAIGWAFPVAFVVWMAFLIFKLRENKLSRRFFYLLKGIVLAAISYCVYFLLNHLIFKIATVEDSAYTNIWGNEPLGVTILENLAYYIGVIEHFFNPQNGQWRFASLLLRSFAVVFIFLGFINRMLRKVSFVEILFITYIGILLIYPYRHSGFRFLLPVLPLLLYFFIHGMQNFQLEFKLSYKYRKYKYLLFGILLVLIYNYNVRKVFLSCDHVIPGPQEPASIECFNYIKSNTTENSVFAFFKPRVLALYADRQSIANYKTQDISSMHERFEIIGVDYLLVHKKYSDKAIREYIRNKNDLFLKDWENEGFILYRKNR